MLLRILRLSLLTSALLNYECIKLLAASIIGVGIQNGIFSTAAQRASQHYIDSLYLLN